MVNDEILEHTKHDSLLSGTARKEVLRRLSFIPRPLVRNDRKGAKLPQLQMKGDKDPGRAQGSASRHQKAMSTMTSFRAEWVLIRRHGEAVTKPQCLLELRGGCSEDNHLCSLSSLSIEPS